MKEKERKKQRKEDSSSWNRKIIFQVLISSAETKSLLPAPASLPMEETKMKTPADAFEVEAWLILEVCGQLLGSQPMPAVNCKAQSIPALVTKANCKISLCLPKPIRIQGWQHRTGKAEQIQKLRRNLSFDHGEWSHYSFIYIIYSYRVFNCCNVQEVANTVLALNACLSKRTVT